VGAVLYYVLASAGLESNVLEMAPAPAPSTPQEAPSAKKTEQEQGAKESD